MQVSPLGVPGLGGPPLGAPGAPGIEPLNAPGPFRPDAFAPGSFIEPAPPGMVPVEAPGAAVEPGVLPGLGRGLLGGLGVVLWMGMVFDGDVHPTLPPPAPKEYDIVPYKDKAPGFHNHHGVLDRWAASNIPGYHSRAPDSITVRLTRLQHDTTTAEYRRWLEERTGKQVGGRIDWNAISPREILELSERMFDAAGVPDVARADYYRAATQYFYQIQINKIP